MKEADIEKTKYFLRQSYAIGLSKNRKIKALSCPNFSGKIQLLFVLFWPFFAEKRAWSHFKGPDSKSNVAYARATISWGLKYAKGLVPPYAGLKPFGHTGRFF